MCTARWETAKSEPGSTFVMTCIFFARAKQLAYQSSTNLYSTLPSLTLAESCFCPVPLVCLLCSSPLRLSENLINQHIYLATIGGTLTDKALTASGEKKQNGKNDELRTECTDRDQQKAGCCFPGSGPSAIPVSPP